MYFKGLLFNYERRWMWASLGHKVVLHQFSFIKQYPILLILQLLTNWGWNGGLQSQTRAQKQDDFMDVSIAPKIQHPCSTGFKIKQANKIVWITHSLTHLFTLLILDDILVFLVMLHLLWTSLLTMSNLGTKLKFTRIRAHTHTQTRQASSTAHRILWAVN